MTEKTEHIAEYLVDPVAFFIALFGGPLLFTLATFWLLFIPVFALVIGAIATLRAVIQPIARPIEPQAPPAEPAKPAV